MPSEVQSYIPGLNGLRFLGAAAVIVHHVEQFKHIAGLPSQWGTPLILHLGSQGVHLFFTLSGFLITWLLIQERERTGDVSIRNFLIRRALRILPLYYLIVLLGFFVMPFFVCNGATPIDLFFAGLYRKLDVAVLSVLGLFLVLLPNISLMLLPSVPFASHCWTLGFEEQFYFAWPWIVKAIKPKVFVAVCAVLLIVCLGCRLYPVLTYAPKPFGFLLRYAAFFPTEYFLAGALAATGYSTTLRVAMPVSICGLLLALAMLTGFVDLGCMNSIAFAAVILCFAAGKPSVANLELAVFRYLGEISYGIYMFHPIAIYAAIKCGFANGAILLVSTAFSIALAAVSFAFLEQPIRGLRHRFVPTLKKHGGCPPGG